MSSPVISVRGLGKKYRLGTTIRHDTLRDTISHGFKSLLSRTQASQTEPNLKSQGSDSKFQEDFWALKDVSFEVQPGEVIGIIGRNGAGKSTLLKILSQITEPTEGEIHIRGRVASLLEVGTGFHPELTGRENIFLNGAILGMAKAEIRKKFDEIVVFSEVEQFLDTPVKRYSSGMYVRLAFAVAAHLEPEILIIDEVLAVGDAAFQKKCLGKMGEVSRAGRTVLFVSHNLTAVRTLCGRCVWIESGAIRRTGRNIAVIDEYLRSADKSQGTAQCEFPEDFRKALQLRSGRLLSPLGEVTQQFDCDSPVLIEMVCQVRRRVPGLYGYLQISKLDGTEVLVSDSYDAPPNPLDELPPGFHRILIRIPARTMGPGWYAVYASFASIAGEQGFAVDIPATLFTFHLSDHTSQRGDARGGFFSMLLAWDIQAVPCPS
jgi:lipopolysaccharide transport system ATP-binding protein